MLKCLSSRGGGTADTYLSKRYEPKAREGANPSPGTKVKDKIVMTI